MLSELSNKENEVLSLIAKGHNNKEIARILCISETTLRSHINRVYDKLDLGDGIRGESSKRVKATLIYLGVE